MCPSTFLLVCESLTGPTRLPDEREEDDTFTLLEESIDEGHMMLSVTPLKKRPWLGLPSTDMVRYPL